MKSVGTDALKEGMDTYVTPLGTFKKIGEHDCIAKDGNVTIGIIAEYEKGKVQYTLSFDPRRCDDRHLHETGKMKKLVLLFCLICLCGCSSNDIPKEKKEELKQKSLMLMEYLQKGEYEKVGKEVSLAVVGLDAEILRHEFSKVPDVYGEFQNVDKIKMMRIESGYQVIVFINFENYKAEYSFAYDENGKVVGIYFK